MFQMNFFAKLKSEKVYKFLFCKGFMPASRNGIARDWKFRLELPALTGIQVRFNLSFLEKKKR